MPYCTECGARHDDSAKVCPKCGQPIFTPPDDDEDDELEGVLASFDTDMDSEDVAKPSAGEPTVDYVEQIQEVRGAIAAQSTALQELSDLTWENATATQIRDELTVALAQLRELVPPPDLADAHSDFAQGAEHLVHGFIALVDAIAKPDADAEVAAAQEEIATATERFRRGADALNDYLVAHEDDMNRDPDDFPAPAALAEDDESDGDEDELDLPDDLFEPAEKVEAEGELSEAEGMGPVAEEEEDDIPPMPAELEDLELDEEAEPRALPTFGAPMAPPQEDEEPEREPVEAADDGGWPTLGDPGTDALLLEIEGGWMRGRPRVHEAIERAVRSSVVDALRDAYQTRARNEEEARAALQKIAGERNRLLDEVEALRRESTMLQAEAAELRRTLNELERERQAAGDRRDQMFQETEARRTQLLTEVAALGGQLDTMRRSIVSLLNTSTTEEPKPTGAATE